MLLKHKELIRPECLWLCSTGTGTGTGVHIARAGVHTHVTKVVSRVFHESWLVDKPGQKRQGWLLKPDCSSFCFFYIFEFSPCIACFAIHCKPRFQFFRLDRFFGKFQTEVLSPLSQIHHSKGFESMVIIDIFFSKGYCKRSLLNSFNFHGIGVLGAKQPQNFLVHFLHVTCYMGTC